VEASLERLLLADTLAWHQLLDGLAELPPGVVESVLRSAVRLPRAEATLVATRGLARSPDAVLEGLARRALPSSDGARARVRGPRAHVPLRRGPRAPRARGVRGRAPRGP
jgi:hypothetical protein